MKKLLSLICAAALTLSCMTAALPGAAAEGTMPSVGTTYYVSSKTGKGGNDGLSASTPFGGLGAVDWKNLQPGDQVLLEKGSEFDGFIHLVDVRGTEVAPIKIGAYGEGAKPRINGKGQGIWFQDYGQQLDNAWHKYQGYVSSTILLYDCDFVEISGLEITNAVPDEESRFQPNEYQGDTVSGSMDRTGVAGAAKNGGIMEHIYLDDLYIHDVDGNIQDKHMNNGGIQLNALKPANESVTGVARYDDVRITNCTVEDVSRAGICVGYTYQWSKFTGSAISDQTIQTYGHTNLYIGNNFVKDAGNDAIVALYSFRPVVESNISDGAGADLPTYVGGTQRFCAGIWPWKCKDAIFQYNEVYNTVGQGNGDGQAFDVDWSDGTVYQYNYSHNNGMGPILFCLTEAYNGVYRYNLSQDDLGCYMTLQGNPNAQIYNNVFYTGPGKSIRVLHEAGSKNNGNAWIANNIFYNNGGTVTENWTGTGEGKTYTNNLFYGFTTTPTDANKVVVTEADKVFVDPGKAPASTTGLIAARTAFDGFKIKTDAPAVNAGIYIENNGNYDFFGNLLDANPDIGIHDTQNKINDTSKELLTSMFDVDKVGKTIKVPVSALAPTTVKNLLDGITVSKFAAVKVTDSADAVQAETTVLADGMKLVITAEDTTADTFTVQIKNVYNHTNDFINNTQGNVWYYQRKQSGVYTNFTQWTADSAGGWWGGQPSDYTSAEKVGLCGDIQSTRTYESSAFAFRAPASGMVEVSFPGQATFRDVNSNNNGGTVHLVLTRNGTPILGKDWQIPAYGTNLDVMPFAITLTAGDWLRFEVVNRGGTISGNGGVALNPLVTYVETDPTTQPGITSEVYAIDDAAHTIKLVPYGTLKADFLSNITLGSDTAVTLVGGSDDTEIADGTAVATGMRLKVAVEGGSTEYYAITTLPRPVSSYTDYVRTGWTAAAGSEQGAEPAGNVLDNNNATIWHTSWSGCTRAQVWITLDMQEVKEIGRVSYLPRQSGGNNGKYRQYEVQVSTDNATWTTVATGTWGTADSYTDVQHATFAPVSARYVKLVGVSTAIAPGADADAGKIFGSAAEINVAMPVYE